MNPFNQNDNQNVNQIDVNQIVSQNEQYDDDSPKYKKKRYNKKKRGKKGGAKKRAAEKREADKIEAERLRNGGSPRIATEGLRTSCRPGAKGGDEHGGATG